MSNPMRIPMRLSFGRNFPEIDTPCEARAVSVSWNLPAPDKTGKISRKVEDRTGTVLVPDLIELMAEESPLLSSYAKYVKSSVESLVFHQVEPFGDWQPLYGLREIDVSLKPRVHVRVHVLAPYDRCSRQLDPETRNNMLYTDLTLTPSPMVSPRTPKFSPSNFDSSAKSPKRRSGESFSSQYTVGFIWDACEEIVACNKGYGDYKKLKLPMDSIFPIAETSFKLSQNGIKHFRQMKKGFAEKAIDLKNPLLRKKCFSLQDMKAWLTSEFPRKKTIHKDLELITRGKKLSKPSSKEAPGPSVKEDKRQFASALKMFRALVLKKSEELSKQSSNLRMSEDTGKESSESVVGKSDIESDGESEGESERESEGESGSERRGESDLSDEEQSGAENGGNSDSGTDTDKLPAKPRRPPSRLAKRSSSSADLPASSKSSKKSKKSRSNKRD